jgi:Superinfection immunity protein
VISSVVSLVIVIGLTGMSLAVYLLPVLIGWSRGAPDIGAITVIDILLGWTLLGWVVALAMAFRSVTPPSPPRHLPPPAADARWAGPAGPPASRPGSPPPLVLPPRPSADQEDVGHGR